MKCMISQKQRCYIMNEPIEQGELRLFAEFHTIILKEYNCVFELDEEITQI